MRRTLIHIITACVLLVLAGLTVWVSICSGRERVGMVCRGLDIRFREPELKFVTDSTVRVFLTRNFGKVEGTPLETIDLKGIEEAIKEKKVITACEVWTTDDGILHMEIGQRLPALRFQQGAKGFYAAKDGYLFPLHSSYEADVPVVYGNIDYVSGGDRSGWIVGLLKMEKKLRGNVKIGAKLDSISIGKTGDILLSNRQGGESVIFGGPWDCGDKMSRIEKYYDRIEPVMGKGYYKSINVKYNKQLICRKDI